MSTDSPISSSSPLKLYWRYTKRYKRSVVAVLVFTPIAVLANNFATPYIAAHLLDHLTKYPNDGIGYYLPWIVLVAAFNLLNMVLWRVIVRHVWGTEIYVARDLARDMFSHLLKQSERFHADHFGGSLVAAGNRFISGHERIIDEASFSLLPLIWTFIFTIAILAPRAPLYVAVLVVVTISYLIVMIRVRSREIPLNEASAAAQSNQTAQLADTITNITTVHSFGQESLEMRRFKERSDARVRRDWKLMNVARRNEYISSSFTESMSVIALFMAIIAVVKFGAAVGTLLLIVNFTGNILGRLWSLQYTIKNYNRTIGDAREMTAILDEEPEVADSEHTETIQLERGEISFKEVAFQYSTAKSKVFTEFNLTILAGERIGLVGPSGSGKTTITKLLLRFADIQSGSISIDGQNIAHLKQSDLRQHIAYVPQEPLLFHRSLADNIRYGQLDATDAEVKEAARRARADEFIDHLPDGYETMVGERGTKLSGGQRQRIAIARAMLKDAPILVLDEATSALDSHSEKLIQEALQELMVGRTTIVIAHRLSTIAQLDRIVVLQDGAITQQGSHHQLLKDGGLYRELWDHQSGGFIEEDDKDVAPELRED